MKALWNEVVLAESEKTIIVEGNYYFPLGSISKEYFKENEAHSICPWKGEASYYDVVVNDEINESAAWYYPDPKDEALNIKSYVAFWNGIEVTE